MKQNRTVLVTGASRGIGKAIANELAEQYSTILTPTRKEMDLLSNDSISNYISQNSKIDILVNNAGILDIANSDEFSPETFQKTLQVNLIGPYLLISKLLEHMKQNRFGRIVNISSVRATVPKDGRSLYSISKSGLNTLTSSLAIELASFNILINSVSPGYVKTDLLANSNSNEELNNRQKSIPIGRFAEPNEIANVVSFLCSTKNSYLTGQTIIVDGAYSLSSNY